MQLYTAVMLITFKKLDSKYLMAGEYAQDPFMRDLVLPVMRQPIERVFGETGEHLKESNNNIRAAILSVRVARNEYPNDSTMMEGYMNAFPNVRCPSCSPCAHDLLSNCSLLVECRSRRRHVWSCRWP
jgi:hypothetical protein